MAQYQFLSFDVVAYLADCSHLSDAEHGRYLRLLFAMWLAPGQRLPNDDEWLARKFGRPVDAVQNELRPLIREFCQIDGNWIWQTRLSRSFARTAKVSRARSDSAKSRWNKEKRPSKGNGIEEKRREDKIREDKKESDALPNGRATRARARKATEAELFPTTENGVDHGNERHTLARDWRPSEDQSSFARSLGLDPDAIGEGFVLWWVEGKGRREQRTDAGWNLTWKGWCRRDADRSRQGAPTGGNAAAVRSAGRGSELAAFARAGAAVSTRKRDGN